MVLDAKEVKKIMKEAKKIPRVEVSIIEEDYLALTHYAEIADEPPLLLDRIIKEFLNRDYVQAALKEYEYRNKIKILENVIDSLKEGINETEDL